MTDSQTVGKGIPQSLNLADCLAGLENRIREFNQKAAENKQATPETEKETKNEEAVKNSTAASETRDDTNTSAERTKKSPLAIAMPPPRNIPAVLQTEGETSSQSEVAENSCPRCGFTSVDKDRFSAHVTSCNPKQATGGLIGKLDKSSSLKNSEKEPIELAYENPYFICKTCDIKLKVRSEFEEHVVCHLLEEPYVCITCKKSFNCRQLLEKHARTSHPNGDSKCGLRGIKKAKRRVEDIEKLGTITLQGKGIIVNTPRQDIKIQPKQSTESLPKSHILTDLLNKETTLAVTSKSSLNISAAQPSLPSIFEKTSSISVTSNSGATCVLSTTVSSGNSTNTLSAPNNTGSLFGVINKQSSDLIPASIPVSIQKIAPVTATTIPPLKGLPDNAPYRVKDIKEYSVTPSNPPHTTPANTQSQVVLIPVGPHVSVLPHKHVYGPVQTSAQVNINQTMSSPGVVQSLPIFLGPNPPVMHKAQQGVVLTQSTPSVIALVSYPQNSIASSSSAAPALTSKHSQLPSLLQPPIQLLTLTQSSNIAPAVVQDTPKDAKKGPAPLKGLVQKDPKKFLFRIKPGQGFVCEACKKFTKEELVFRRHVWEHFHGKQLVCKTCSPQNIATKFIIGCQLVNNITCNLIKRSTEEIAAASVNTQSNEVISISDDEEDGSKEDKTGHSAEVVCIEDDNDEETGLNIKISSSYSLTDNKSLEQMTSKCDQLASMPEKTEECILGEMQQSVQLDTLDNTCNKEKAPIQLEANTCNKEKAPIQLEATPETEPEKQTTEDATHTNPQTNDANIITTKGTKTKEKGCGEKSKIHEDFKMLARHQKKDSDLPVRESENPAIEGKNKEKLLKEENEIMTQQPDMAFYMCGFEQCSFICLMSSKYRAHLQEKHSSVVNYICSHCGQKDFTEDSHLRHMFTHTNSKKFMLYPCPVKQCKYQTNMLNMYRDHFVIHQHDEHINCVYCHKTFQNAESLVCHLRANLLKFISCPHCSFKFAKRSAVSKHIKVSHPEKPNLVTVTCQVVCLEREVNFYVVPESSGGIDIPALLEEVQKGCINSKGQGPASKVTELERVQKRLVESGSVSALKSSTEKKKTKERMNTSVGPKSLKCPRCTYLSHNQSFYVQHISLHDEEPQRDKRFVCHICPKGFDNYAQLKRHAMNHIGRNQLKIFKCTLCTYTSNQKCHIMDHCADSHDGKGMYVEELEEIISNESACKYCEFRARQPEHVAQHESAVHATSSHDYDSDQKRAEETTKCLNEKESEGPKKRKYHCDYCKEFFKHKVDLKQHMQTGHRDIESKQFTFYKCKHCSYTSTMKDFILNHIHKDHSGKELRILRKIEKIETSKSGISKDTGIAGSTSGDSVENITVMEDRNLLEDEKQEEVAIPDGNTFKQPFQCPKCNFSTNLRIAVMRHIKVHAELKPVRQIKPSSIPSKTTARKSTTRMSVETKDHISRSTLIQDIPQSSVQLSNPFHSVREVVDELEKEGTNYEDYQLGEQTLHMKLFSCYKYIEEEKKFKCLICKQKITKKFVLHRHILDHLKIVFFKCKYCGEGSIEQSLMTAHIQKEHPGKPLLHEKMSSAELDMQLAERVSSQDFSDVEIKTLSEGSDSSVGVDTPQHIVKRQVHEAISVDDDESESTPVKMRTYSCDKCRYVTTRANHYQLHIESHVDPEKCYYCSACFFRSQRINVIKHMYRAKCKSKSCMCLKDDSVGDQTENQINTVASSVQAKQVDAGDQVTEENKSNQELNAETHIKVCGKTCPGMKTIYKCKECGFKRESKSALYRHLKSSCKGPRYQCSLCSFQNKTKKNIKVHGRLRHPGKKLKVFDLPTNAKFKEVKVAIKPDDGTTQEKDSLSSTKDTSKPLSPERASSKYQCKICSKYVTDVMNLQFHINTLHGGKSLYCVHCAYKTPLVKHMINHCTHVHRQSSPKYRLHPNDMETDVNDVSNDSFAARKGNWICPSCPYQNGKLSLVKKHLLSHFTYKPYVCKYCGQSCSTLANLKRHFSTAHPRKTENFKRVTDKSKEHAIHAMWAKIKRVHPDVSDTNDTCQITTPKKREYHFDASDGPPTPKRQKLDTVESLDVKNEVSLDAALKYQVILDTSGTRFFKCSLCDFKAERKLTLQLHLNNHGSKFFKCFYCDYTTKMLTNAIRHHDQKHGDSLIKIVNKKTKEVISPLKKRDPGTSDEEYKPKRIMSITALKYFCNKCPHVCDSLFLYRQHLAGHSGFTYLTEASGIDSKLSCGYCAYIASDNTDFSNHISSHLEMRRLKCGYCQFSDHLRKQILVHLRNEHPGQPECITNLSLQNATAARYQLVNFDPQVVLKRLDIGGVQVKRKFRRIHMETDSESDEENDSSRKSAKLDVVQVEKKATVCNINDQDTVCGENLESCELKPVHDQEPVESAESERMDLNSEVIDDTSAKLTDEFGETVMEVNNSEESALTVENESRPRADLESKEASETFEKDKQVADEIDTTNDETLQGDDGSKQESERNVFDMFNG